MLGESEKFLVRGNPMQRVLAGATRGYFDAEGKGIPFPASEQTLSLEQATREYKNNLVSPECLTQFMRSFWTEASRKIKINIVVDKFPLTATEIKERQEKGYMAIFVPDGVNRVDLGRMFPKMESRVVREAKSAVDVANNSGWLWVETSVDTPNRNTTQGQLEEKFKKEGKQGQSLRNYIVGSQISELLTDRYFDEGSTWSRLLGSCYVGGVVNSHFDSSGHLFVYWISSPECHVEYVGGRSEEVIKP